MTRLRNAVVAAALLVPPSLTSEQIELSFDAITVHLARLGSECRLPASPTVRVANRVSLGWWAGLPIASNPWRGSDEAAIVSIRERIEPPIAGPDGPPLSPVQLGRFRAQLAREVEEGYAAVYVAGSADSATDVVTVLALRFKTARDLERLRANPKLPRSVQFVGRTAFFVAGQRNACYEIVTEHLREAFAAKDFR